MRAGLLLDRITLQSKSVTRDAYGGEVVSWVDQAMVWAKVTPVRGREYIAALQAQERLDLRIFIRYRTDVRPDWRLLWRDVPYAITQVADIDARKRELELVCVGETPT